MQPSKLTRPPPLPPALPPRLPSTTASSISISSPSPSPSLNRSLSPTSMNVNSDDSTSTNTSTLSESSSPSSPSLNSNINSSSWVEYRDAESGSSSIYYNKSTGQVRHSNNDNDNDSNNTTIVDDMDDDDDEIITRPHSRTLAIAVNVKPMHATLRGKQESLATSAWIHEERENNNNNNTAMPINERALLKQNSESELKNRDDDSLSALLPSSPSSSRLPSLSRMVKMMSIISSQFAIIVPDSYSLAPSCTDALISLRTQIDLMTSTLETLESGSEKDNRTDIEALTEYDKLQWSFDNMHVHHYRAAAAAVKHDEYEFKDWHAPQYFSIAPIPPNVKSITAIIKLPLSDSSSSSSSSSSPSDNNSKLTHTRIQITERDSAANAITASLAKCKDRLPQADVRDYVLKAVGLHDYLFGDRPLFDYEYVRTCMRDADTLRLSLIRRPQPLPPLANESVSKNAYMEKVKSDIRPLINDEYRTVTRAPDANANASLVALTDLKVLSMSEITMPFRVRILGLDNVTESSVPRLGSVSHICVRAFLFNGTSMLNDPMETDTLSVSSAPRWVTAPISFAVNKQQQDVVTLSSLPRTARVCMLLIGKSTTSNTDIILGWVALQLVDEKGELVQGRKTLRMWSMDVHKKGKHGKQREPDLDFMFRATTSENMSDPIAPQLYVAFDEWSCPVVSPLVERPREPNLRLLPPDIPLKQLTKQQLKHRDQLLESDALYVLTNDDKALLWMSRHSLLQFPRMLPKFLQSVNFGNNDQKFEAHKLLSRWSPPSPCSAALELLDAKYPDYTVREYAVNLLRAITDDELQLYLLQFVQCIKFEAYHDSPLVRFLMERALRSPLSIGHFLFWHLKAELHDAACCERFYLIIEELLSFCPRLACELRKQNAAVLKLQRVAELIVRLKREMGLSDQEATPDYVKELNRLNTFLTKQGKFQIPLNPRLEATSLIVHKCRYMSSKMVPLLLVFQNTDPDANPIFIIFKSGDDLRQDILTLQLLTVMDRLWLSAGLDLRMKPYRCIATGINEAGDGVGMIEVVLNSDTTSGIQLKYGGGAVGALKDDPIDLFLRDHNRGDLYDKAVLNFVCSCAGYCVATFILGIGDRHNGNIMITRSGHLFHIDFGHFLGNFKKKFGVNRERAAFVFTPEMAYVMGGKKYESHALFKQFMQLSTRSFNTLRQNAPWLENLFVLMSAAGMPELMCESDIYYMKDKLLLNVDEKKADKLFTEEVHKSLQTTFRRFDNFVHNYIHG